MMQEKVIAEYHNYLPHATRAFLILLMAPMSDTDDDDQGSIISVMCMPWDILATILHIGAESCEVFHDFADILSPLHQPLLGGIFSYGLKRPSGLQKQIMAPLLWGRDAFIRGRAGSGKTTSLP